MKRMELETRDLILKRAVFEDWHQIYTNLWRHEESSRYMLWEPTFSEEAARARMERTIDFQAEHPLTWFIYEKSGGQAIGFAGLEEIAPGVYEDASVALGPDYVGRGYGKQVLKALAHLVFERLDGIRFVCSCRSVNLASRNLQLSCGFTYTHSENRIDARNGEAYVLDFHELTREQFYR
jgi:RimJ/RimL family protein N-acetyltransferase